MQIPINSSKIETAYHNNQSLAKTLAEKNESEISNRKIDTKSISTFLKSNEVGKQQDSVQISSEGIAALHKSLSSTSKGIKITNDGNNYSVSFKNPAFAYGAVKRGYIDIDGEKFVLSDKDKSELKKAADKSFNQMQNDTLNAAMEHNSHVLRQQAEAIKNAGKEDWELLGMLIDVKKSNDEWISPLKQLENRSVSMDIEKTVGGFSIKAINTTLGDTF